MKKKQKRKGKCTKSTGEYVPCRRFYAVVFVIFLIVLASFIFINNREALVGKVAYANMGCCELTCQQTSKQECPNNLNYGKECNELPQCNVGCCLDQEGYCLDNYLSSNCKAKGTFFPTNCVNVPVCVTEKKSGTITKSTGFPVVYKFKDFLYTEPSSGKIGALFVIKILLLEPMNRSSVEVNLISENYTKTVTLFDDGNHGDGNKGDGTFAGVWDSAELSSFSGMRKVELYYLTLHTTILLSSTSCLPISADSKKETAQNIIFLSSSPQTGIDSIQQKVEGITTLLLSLSKPEASNISITFPNNKFNYYFVSKSGIINNPESAVQEECFFLKNETQKSNSTEENIIIYLNYENPFCHQGGDIIDLSPEFIIKNDVLKNGTTPEELINNFCKYILTVKEFQDKYLAKKIPPTIEIIFFSENEVTSPISNLSFFISDNQNNPLNYAIYYDIGHPMTYLYQNQTAPDNLTELSLSIPDGDHILWIEAVDNDGNIALSKAIPVKKNVNNFVVQILSLDKISHVTSPDINFLITHKDYVAPPDINGLITPTITFKESEGDINYILWVDNQSIAQGKVKPSVEEIIPTQIEDGEHTIYITAQDAYNNTATSLPYYIIVGTEEEPPLYEAGIEWYEYSPIETGEGEYES